MRKTMENRYLAADLSAEKPVSEEIRLIIKLVLVLGAFLLTAMIEGGAIL